jgi:hypothetical protein
MDLPNELRLQITGHLDTVDLLSLVRVNRKFRAAAADCLYKVVQIPLSRYVQNGLCQPWDLPHGPVLFAPGYTACLLSRTSPLGLVRAPFST